MLIECRECKNPVSDQAPACPHCGVAATTGGKAVKVGSRRKATQFVWFFFWIFVAGVVWPIFSESSDNTVGAVLLISGMVGWIGALIYRMTNT